MAETTINLDIRMVSQQFENALRHMAELLGAVKRRYREAGWMSPHWVGRRKCKRSEASIYLRHRLPGAWRVTPFVNIWYPTTAELRRVLHDKSTPRAVKCHVYSMLRVRRTRCSA